MCSAKWRQLHRGKLSIAANEFTALYLLPAPARFRRLHPMIRIAVERSLGSHIPGDVLRHNTELGVLTYDPQEPQLHSIVAYLDELIFAVPPTHPLAGESGQYPAIGRGIVRRPHCFFSVSRKSHSGIPAPQDTAAHGQSESPTLQAIKRFVAMGNAGGVICLLSVWKTNWRGANWSVSRCGSCVCTGNCGVVHREAASLSHAARAFLKVAEAFALEHRGPYRFQREH